MISRLSFAAFRFRAGKYEIVMNPSIQMENITRRIIMEADCLKSNIYIYIDGMARHERVSVQFLKSRN